MRFFLCMVLFIASFNVFANGVITENRQMQSAPTQLDDLIRGEMSAVNVYNQVIKDLKDNSERAKLEGIRNNHEQAVSKLKVFASKDVREDTTTSGVWGTFTKGWTGAAKIMGNKTALKALTQGEQHGIDEYLEALEDKNIKPEVKNLIKAELLPKTREHIKSIKTFM